MLKQVFVLVVACLFVTGTAKAQVSYPPRPVDLSGVATQAQLNAVAAAVPLPAVSAPPAVTDQNVGTLGTAPRYALENHTHASKARKARIQTAADGTVTWTFSPAFDPGVVPRCQAVAETTQGATDVINAQIDGTPTNTGVLLRVTRTQRSVVALIGLTVLSIPASPGATWVHAFCTEP